MTTFIVAPGFLELEVIEHEEGKVARTIARFKRENEDDALLVARLLNEHYTVREEEN